MVTHKNKKRTPKKHDNELHAKAMEHFDKAYAFDKDERDKCIDDANFVTKEDGQWDSHAQTARANRPRYTVDKVSPAVNQVIGEYRQSRVSIKVRPSHGGSTDIAETYNGLIRNLAAISKAQHAYDTAFRNVVTSGFGAFRITTEYNDDDVFDQDIMIKPITSPITDVWVDPNTKDPNGRDAKWMFVIQEMSKEVFKRKYPDAIASDFDGTLLTLNGNTCQSGWSRHDTVRVAEYWVKETVPDVLILLSDQRTINKEEFDKIGDELAERNITEIRRRSIHRPKITFYRLSGSEILEGPKEWAGKYIPIILIYGYNNWINNYHHYRGIVRKAKDPQRIYNYTVSSIIEATALAPKDPWLVSNKMIAGHEKIWKDINIENRPFLPYNIDPLAPNASPKREGAPAVQQALIMQSQQAEADIQATTGLFAPSLGDSPSNQSGRAILAVQRQGDRGSSELFDNLSKGIEYAGEILIDLIPKIYDIARQIRILSEDGTTEIVTINEPVRNDETGEIVLVNDLSEGKYDLTITTGPDFATKRSEGLNILNTLSSANPAMAPLLLDLIAKNLDFPFAEELNDRIRKQQFGLPFMEPDDEERTAIQQAQQAALDAETANAGLNAKVTEVQLTNADLTNQELSAKIDGMEIDNDNKRVDIEKTRAGMQKTLVEASAIKVKAGLPITPEEIEARHANIELLNDGMEFSKVALSQEAAEIFPAGVSEGAEVNVPVEEAQPQLVQDPESGLLVDIDSGAIFDPNTQERLN